MHQILTSLETGGLVIREASENHAHVRLAFVTLSRESDLEQCDAVVDVLESDVFSDLSVSDREALRRLLERSI